MKPQYVMMAVKCLGKACINCDQLQVTNERIDIPSLSGDKKEMVNVISCDNVWRCIKIAQMMEEWNNVKTDDIGRG